MATHQLKPSRATLHGTFSRNWAPILTIDPGDTVVFETLDARWTVQPPPDQFTAGPRFAPRDDLRDNGHALCGPIRINGAAPGMVLVVQIGEIVPGNWGWNVGGGWANGINDRLGLAETEVRLGWNIDIAAGIATDQFGHTVQLAPFFGVMGMPGNGHDPVPSWTPRPGGGNIDCKELVAGTTLYLPIAVEGGMFSAGDGHAAQGDGEVSTTAIECPIASGSLTFSLRNDVALTMPMARTLHAWITFGFHEDLDEAVLLALDGMLDLFGREYAVDRNTALALCSVAADVRVTQIVNGVKGVHVVLQDDAIGGLIAARTN
ncbi:MAG: acetamidase/formamidase family protein [Chloroflexia bacterium]|nr:acetamidase/formamidase family protein [Chloroflexia bacterium]